MKYNGLPKKATGREKKISETEIEVLVSAIEFNQKV